MRFCSNCFTCKDLSEFPKRKSSADGLDGWCKKCKNQYHAVYYKKDLEKSRTRALSYYYKDKSHSKEKARLANIRNNEQKLAYGRKYREENRELVRKMGRDYYQNNKEKVAKYVRDRRRNDDLFKLKSGLRSRIWGAFDDKHWDRTKGIGKIIGVDYATVKIYIERQFNKGMNWGNYGRFGWHLDHKIPLGSAKSKEELITLCHYTNLQPMWWQENIIKADKVFDTQMKIAI